MSDLLVRRLKAIKRELTALKTAHQRGLGLLKVYPEEVELDVDGRTGIWDVIVTLNFDQKFAPFPIVESIYTVDNPYIEEMAIFYSDDGFAAYITFGWAFVAPVSKSVKFVTSAPVISTSQVWTRT